MHLPSSVVAEVQLEQFAQARQGREVCDHASFLVGGVVGEVHATHSLRQHPSKEWCRFILLRDVVLLLHGVVALQEGAAASQSAFDEGNVDGLQTDVLEGLGLWVEVELALARVVIVL